MIVSPCFRDDLEKKSHFSAVTKDGVIILNDDSPEVSPAKRGLKRKLDSDDFTSDPVSD
jgi:hypothetical protein